MHRTDWPETQAEMLELSPTAFEEFAAAVWSARSFETTVTQGSNDAGVDVVAKRDGDRTAIQAKRYRRSNRVGGPEIQQYSSLLHDETIDDVVVVTSSTFTNAAYRRAQEIGLDLVDGERLLSLADQHRDSSQTDSESTSESLTLGKLLLAPFVWTWVYLVVAAKFTVWYFKLIWKLFTWPFRR